MSQMVDTLLVLAREEEVIEEDVPSVSALAQSIIADSSHLLKDKPIHLNFQYVHDFCLEAPASILKLLLGNVLRNAIAYTKEGNITVTVESPYIKIADTGKGISTEHLPRIFDRHFRVENSESMGSGVGLAIVKRICDRYGWPIDISSAAGKGTLVSIDFTKTIEFDD
jgi:signal transduction histidine kinase